MPALLIYLLKVNAALLLFCLGYYGVLRKLTFYTLNRVYLITAILFSSLYPAINIDSLLQRHEKLSAPLQPIQVVVIDFSDRVTQIAQPAAQTNYWQWIIMLFWAGVVVMAFRLAAQFWSLFRIYKRSAPAQLYNQPVRVIDEEANPFSFWQSIYINPKHHAEGELRSIIAHEQIHVKQWHTLDILLAEVSLVFYWFNPGVWLMKKAVAENLEFITDRKILQQGIDAKSYQYSLLYASFNTSPNAMVNHFNISTIKKRIMMMNSKKSSRFGLARYGFIAPAVLVLLLMFGTSKAAFLKKQLQTTATAISQQISTITESPSPAVEVKETAQPVTNKPEELVAYQASPINITDTNNAGYRVIDTPKLKKNIKISVLGSDSSYYVIDGKNIKAENLEAINPEDIASINLLYNSQAVNLFGAQAKNGAVVITTKRGAKTAVVQELVKRIQGRNEIREVIVDGKPLYGSRVRGIAIDSSKIDSTRTVRIRAITGRLTTTAATFKLQKQRDSIDRLIGETIRKEVAAARDNKDIVVTGYGTKRTGIRLSGTPLPGKEPLWVLDGKAQVYSPLNELNTNNIESITVLKDASAIAMYGEQAANGVVIITTKKAVKNPPKKN